MSTERSNDRGHAATFGAVWLGQLVSILGTSLTTFALGLWVLRSRGSVTDYALVGFCAVLPRVLLSPVAGVAVDRFGRRRTMLVAGLGGAAGSALILALVRADALAVWQVYLATALGGVLGAFEWPAWRAATSVLVPASQLGRASGLTSLADAASTIVGPVLAALLLVAAGIETILLLDVATFLYAAATLALVRFPEPVGAARAPARDEVAAGLRYITGDRGLAALVGFLASVTFQWGVVAALVTPMVLGYASTIELGQVLSAAGLGALSGSIFMTLTGGPRRRVRTLVVAEAASGVAFVAMGLSTSVATVAAAVFAAHVTIPIIAGSDQVIWQRRVPEALQGRVFAARQMLESAPGPFAFVLAGPLAERLFDPALAPGGPLAGSIGPIFGSGDARGIGLLFAVLGVMQLLIALGGLSSRRLRALDDGAPSIRPVAGYHPLVDPSSTEVA